MKSYKCLNWNIETLGLGVQTKAILTAVPRAYRQPYCLSSIRKSAMLKFPWYVWTFWYQKNESQYKIQQRLLQNQCTVSVQISQFWKFAQNTNPTTEIKEQQKAWDKKTCEGLWLQQVFAHYIYTSHNCGGSSNYFLTQCFLILSGNKIWWLT